MHSNCTMNRKNQAYHGEPCRRNHGITNSRNISQYLSMARKSVDIAAQLITSHNIADVLAKLHEKGVKIRVVVDQEVHQLGIGTDYFHNLRQMGVKFRMNGCVGKRSGTLHHKFILVDSKILLVGSMNFTLAAVLMNHEVLAVLSVQSVVAEYVRCFDRLWEKFACFAIE